MNIQSAKAELYGAPLCPAGHLPPCGTVAKSCGCDSLFLRWGFCDDDEAERSVQFCGGSAAAGSWSKRSAGSAVVAGEVVSLREDPGAAAPGGWARTACLQFS